MKWIQLSVHTTTMGAEVISGLLMEIGACGTEIVDRYDVLSADKRDGMWDMIDEHVLQNMPEEVIVKAYFQADGNEDGTYILNRTQTTPGLLNSIKKNPGLSYPELDKEEKPNHE